MITYQASRSRWFPVGQEAIYHSREVRRTQSREEALERAEESLYRWQNRAWYKRAWCWLTAPIINNMENDHVAV